MGRDTPAAPTEPDDVERRYRASLAQALRRLHICRGTNGDTIREALPAIEQRIGVQRGGIPNVDTEAYPHAAWGTLGECTVRGSSNREIVLAAPTSEPETNDHDLNGLALLTVLCEWLASAPRRFTYRAIFAPAALSVRSSLRLRGVDASTLAGGIALYQLGGAAPLTYRHSRAPSSLIDRAVDQVLKRPDTNHSVTVGQGPDEHAYSTGGLDARFSSLHRCRHEKPQPGAADMDRSARGLAQSFAFCREWLENLENGAQVWMNLAPYGEPCLGKRGLYHVSDPRRGPDAAHMALLWVLNLSDGHHSLLDIAERSDMPLALVARAAERLQQGGLLKASEPDNRAATPAAG